jgi:ubiquinone/menaquinone biosynthesis C-methylase UbiE
MKNRESWQKNKYAKFWVEQVNNYGFDEYCKGLIKLLLSKNPSNAYELAIGTGWPFATSLSERNISVSGSDISELLVEGIKSKYLVIDAVVQSYEDIRPNPEKKYDLVYCLRSTWHFPNIFKALDSMFMMVKNEGYVVFDIMNKDSDYIISMIRTHRLMFLFTVVRNLTKIVLNTFFRKSFLVQDIWNIHDIPVSPKDVEAYLVNKGVSFKKYSINQIRDNINNEFKDYGEFNSKLIYECQFIKNDIS